MNSWALIPVKPIETAKTRLGGVLTASERTRLFMVMLHHVASVAAAARQIERVCILGPSRFGLPDHFTLFPDPGEGLNAALQATLSKLKTSRLIIIHADLPELTEQDIALLANVPENTIAIAPDRHDTGTNALSLPLPAAGHFTFAFGKDSLARHRAEADRIGMSSKTIRSPGLSLDIDEPKDLSNAQSLLDQLMTTRPTEPSPASRSS